MGKGSIHFAPSRVGGLELGFKVHGLTLLQLFLSDLLEPAHLPKASKLVAVSERECASAFSLACMVDALEEVATRFNAAAVAVLAAVRESTFQDKVVVEDHAADAVGLAPRAQCSNIRVISGFLGLNCTLRREESGEDFFLLGVEIGARHLSLDSLHERLGTLDFLVPHVVHLFQGTLVGPLTVLLNDLNRQFSFACPKLGRYATAVAILVENDRHFTESFLINLFGQMALEHITDQPACSIVFVITAFHFLVQK